MPDFRELQFGVYAIQLGWLSIRDLAEHWKTSRESDDPRLDYHLIRSGAISARQAELLTGLVGENPVDNDPEETLITTGQSLTNSWNSAPILLRLKQALESKSIAEWERVSWLDWLNATMGSEQRDSVGEGTDPHQTIAPPSPVAAPRSAGDTPYRFQKQREFARGGLGAVFLANDLEVSREVALKEMLPSSHVDARTKQRFLREAEITGGLEHPGIVPVYGIGVYDDGRPFYAMRLIRGEELRHSISEFHRKRAEGTFENLVQEKIELRQLLDRFRAVCQAVQYAHDQGYVHRDLKPSNIMLGKYGETMIVDWGLAKQFGDTEQTNANRKSLPSQSDADHTAAGTIVGTPAYMSSEQATGRSDIDHLSDVYSLGATLFELLTGEAPFRDSISDGFQKLFQVKANGPVPDPCESNSSVPKALAAVCVKSMAVEPCKRFSSASEIASEIERWQADEPLDSYREPLWNRTRRWMRKHQTLVVAASLALFLITIGSVSLAALWKFHSSEITKANVALSESNKKESEARQQAQDNEKLALASEAIAKEQSKLALATLQDVVYKVERQLVSLPGSAKARREIMILATDRLDKIAGQYVSQQTLDTTTCQALMQLGGIATRVSGQSEDSKPKQLRGANGETIATLFLEETSATKLARQLYQRSKDIALQLNVRRPNDRTILGVLGDVEYRIGSLEFFVGHSEESYAHFANAVKHYQAANAIQSDPNMRQSITRSQMWSADAAMHNGDFLKAVEILKEAIESRAGEATKVEIAKIRFRLAKAASFLGKPTESIESFNEAIRLFKDAISVTNGATKADLQELLAGAIEQRVGVSLIHGVASGSVKSLDEALELRRMLFQREPQNPHQIRSLAGGLFRTGAFTIVFDPDLALRRIEEASELMAQQVKRDPENASDKVTLGNILTLRGLLVPKQQAGEYYRQAYEHITSARKLVPSSEAIDEVFALMVVQYAGSQSQEQLDRGHALFQEGISVSRKLEASGTPLRKSQLARALAAYASWANRIDPENKEVPKLYDEAIAVHESIIGDAFQSPVQLIEYASALINRAHIDAEPNHPRVRGWLSKSNEILTAVLEDSSDATHIALAADAAYGHAETCELLGFRELALESYQQVEPVVQDWLANYKGSNMMNLLLVQITSCRGRVLLSSGRQDDAVRAFEQAALTLQSAEGAQNLGADADRLLGFFTPWAQTLASQGDEEGAKMIAERGLAEVKRFAGAQETELNLHFELGQALASLGQPDQAIKEYRAAEKLVPQSPLVTSAHWSSSILQQLAYNHSQLGDGKEACELSRQACKVLAETNDISIAHLYEGAVQQLGYYVSQVEGEDAGWQEQERSLDYFRRLSQAGQLNKAALQYYAQLAQPVAQWYWYTGQWQLAIERYTEVIQVLQTYIDRGFAVGEDTEVSIYEMRELLVTVYVNVGQWEEADRVFAQRRAYVHGKFQKQPANQNVVAEWEQILRAAGELELVQFKFDQAKQQYEEALKVSNAVLDSFPSAKKEAQSEIELLENFIKHCQDAAKFAEDPNAEQELDPELIVSNLRLLTNFARFPDSKDPLTARMSGEARIEKSRELRKQLSEMEADDLDSIYARVCADSLLFGGLTKWSKTKDDNELRNQRTDCESQALDWLDQALKKGFINQYQLVTDPDLEPIRQHKRFQAVVRQLNDPQ